MIIKDLKIRYCIVKYGETFYNRHTALTPAAVKINRFHTSFVQKKKKKKTTENCHNFPSVIIFIDRFYLSFFVATRGFRDSGFDFYWFCINPCKKVDHVCILVRHWIDTNQKVVRFVLDLWFKSPYELLRKLTLIHVQTTKAQISLRIRADWSAPCFFFSFFSTEKLHKLKWRAKWFSGMY